MFKCKFDASEQYKSAFINIHFRGFIVLQGVVSEPHLVFCRDSFRVCCVFTERSYTVLFRISKCFCTVGMVAKGNASGKMLRRR